MRMAVRTAILDAVIADQPVDEVLRNALDAAAKAAWDAQHDTRQQIRFERAGGFSHARGGKPLTVQAT